LGSRPTRTKHLKSWKSKKMTKDKPPNHHTSFWGVK
jgi:hypothetical protein